MRIVILTFTVISLISCSKNNKTTGESINGPTVASNAWIAAHSDSWVTSNFDANVAPATLIVGDENVYNWYYAPRGSTPAPANWNLELLSVINGVNRGSVGMTFNDVSYIDQIKQHRYITKSVYVMLGTNDIYTYGINNDIWGTTTFKTKFKTFMWYLMNNFNAQQIRVVQIPDNSYAHAFVGSQAIPRLNDSITKWCDSAVNDRVKFVWAQPPYFNGKYISYASLANGYSTTYCADFRSNFQLGSVHVAQTPKAAAYNATGIRCKSIASYIPNAAPSSDVDGTVMNYVWTTGTPGITITNQYTATPTISKTGTWPASVVLTLQVIDNEGLTNSKNFVSSFFNCP